MSALAVAWFPPEDLSNALEEWPDLLSDWPGLHGVERYNRKIEADLRQLRKRGTAELFISPIHLEEFKAWCAEEGLYPGDSAARAQFAAVVAQRGGAISWPPGRNGPCWCGSGQR